MEGGDGRTGGGDEMATEMGSGEMEHDIQRILEKIDQFTQQVWELLDAGRTLFKTLSSEFEERLISIHKEQMAKWQEEIKEMQLRDTCNEAARALLENAQHLLRSAPQASPTQQPLQDFSGET
ncbi:unnamed protein product [Musa acuminata var. zebrina]